MAGSEIIDLAQSQAGRKTWAEVGDIALGTDPDILITREGVAICELAAAQNIAWQAVARKGDVSARFRLQGNYLIFPRGYFRRGDLAAVAGRRDPEISLGILLRRFRYDY